MHGAEGVGIELRGTRTTCVKWPLHCRCGASQLCGPSVVRKVLLAWTTTHTDGFSKLVA